MEAVRPEENKVIQVSMHDTLRPGLETWLAIRGLELVRTPHLDATEDVEQYIVVPALPPNQIRFSGPL